MDENLNQRNKGQFKNDYPCQTPKNQEDVSVETSLCQPDDLGENQTEDSFVYQAVSPLHKQPAYYTNITDLPEESASPPVESAPKHAKYQQKQEAFFSQYDDGGTEYPYKQPNFDSQQMYQGWSEPIPFYSDTCVNPNLYPYIPPYPYANNGSVGWSQNSYEQPFSDWQNEGQQMGGWLNGSQVQMPMNSWAQPNRKINWGTKIFLLILAVLAVGFTVSFFVFGTVVVIQGNYSVVQEDNSTSSRYSKPQTSEPKMEEGISNQTNPAFQGLDIVPATGEAMTPEQVYQKAAVSMVSVLSVTGSNQNESDSSSQGSGIIATADGYIITNAHVINYTKSAKVAVVTHDQKRYNGIVVGFDKDADLAVIKIEAQDLTAAVFGDANNLAVGETVIAIGNPGGVRYSGSMTMGIISALNRSIENYSSTGITYIQTDTAINPGNSGGGLINRYGQVVGINTIKVVSSGYEGMGFSIPIDQAKSILDTLIREGSIPAVGRLGITGGTQYLPVDGQNYTVASGVLVSSVDSESPLQNSDLRQGDLIIGFNGSAILTLEDIYSQLKDCRVGQEVILTIRRITDDGDNVFEVKTNILKRNS